MVRENPSRVHYAEKLQEMIDRYNAGSQEHRGVLRGAEEARSVAVTKRSSAQSERS